MTTPKEGQTPRARQILLVDDSTDFTELFKEFLLSYRPGEWVVHTADHYAPALACLKEHSIDVAVIDLNMPIMDGMQLLSLIKRNYPELPVVMLTAAASTETRIQCLQAGAALFFDKTEVANGLEKMYAGLESVASTPPEGVRGVLRQVGLTDVMQLECLGRKSSVLEVSSPQESGRIFIHDGSLIHAEIGKLQGEPALFHLLALKGGGFSLKPFVQPAKRTIDGHWESLLMEAARLRDEASAGPGGLGGGSATADAAKAAASAERKIEEILLCSNTGEVLYEWQTHATDRRVQLLNRLFKMSDSFAQSLLLTRVDRLEIEADGKRTVLLLQPDRRVFVRSIPAAENPK
jgi:CheY-like chemotaxis protein